MINVCFKCGLNRPDKVIDPDGPYAICPGCGYKHPFRRLPLLIICGASGTGKSTVGQHLIRELREVVVLEGDILWREEFNKPQDKYRGFFETWLRMCKNISQAGKPVVLICSGGIPENVEECVERRYFTQVHYLGLTCDDAELEERLRRRPAWRKCDNVAYIQKHVKFNRWFKEDRIAPKIDVLDTTGVVVEETARQVASWIRNKVQGVIS